MGILVLKRLEDAVADRDNIRGVIKGSAINNDGAAKVGYTAPSLDGQAAVIAEEAPIRQQISQVINGVESCVVSGTKDAIALLAQELESQGINSRLLHTSHAFHSPMMAGVIEPFKQQLAQVTLNLPQMPFLSNLTGHSFIANGDRAFPSPAIRLNVSVTGCQQQTTIRA